MTQVTLQTNIRQALKVLEIKPFVPTAPNRAMRRLPLKDRDIVSEFYQFFSEMNTDTAHEIYSYLLYLSLRYRIVYPCQDRIGEFADVTSRTVRRILNLLKQHNLITVHNRGYNTCVYILPTELLNLRVMNALSGLFPILKTVAIMTLYLSGRPMDSRNVLPQSPERTRLLNIYKFIIERGGVQKKFGGFLDITSKRNTVYELISAMNKKLSTELGINQFGMILNTAFDDETLQIAYNIVLKKKDLKGEKLYYYFFRLCHRISEKMNKKPNYVQMYAFVEASGYKPGYPTMMGADPEANPRYNDKFELQKTKSPQVVSLPSEEKKSSGRPGFAEYLQKMLNL